MMSRHLPRMTIAEQTAEFLRKGIRSGRWSGRLPGALRLARELDVSKASLIAALDMLEAEGLIIPKGVGKHREVAASPTLRPPGRKLRVGLLPYEDPAHANAFKQHQIFGIAAGVEADGHTFFIASRSQLALKSDPERLVRQLRSESADVWILLNPLAELQQAVLAAGIPAISIGGRTDCGLPAAAYTMGRALADATDRLLALGHRRIALVCPVNWRKPEPNAYARDFLERLDRAGASGGDYGLPDWTETPEGFDRLLRSLFALTPPTALIVGDARQAMAVIQYLSLNGLRIGKDVSLVVRIPDPVFEWTTPSVAHFEFDADQVVRSVTRRLAAFAKGTVDTGAELFPSRFVDGGTVGPAPRR